MSTHGRVNLADVEAYLQDVVSSHVDPKTNEVNLTALVEDAAHEFGHEDWLDDDQHEVWFIAVDIAEAHEAAIAQFDPRETGAIAYLYLGA